MSYFPSSQNLPELLHHPSAIAALISIGIHGLLALSLPTLSAASKPEESSDQESQGGGWYPEPDHDPNC